jgi:hypothetical protein
MGVSTYGTVADLLTGAANLFDPILWVLKDEPFDRATCPPAVGWA